MLEILDMLVRLEIVVETNARNRDKFKNESHNANIIFLLFIILLWGTLCL